jgi:hypothetical protein
MYQALSVAAWNTAGLIWIRSYSSKKHKFCNRLWDILNKSEFCRMKKG